MSAISSYIQDYNNFDRSFNKFIRTEYLLDDYLLPENKPSYELDNYYDSIYTNKGKVKTTDIINLEFQTFRDSKELLLSLLNSFINSARDNKLYHKSNEFIYGNRSVGFLKKSEKDNASVIENSFDKLNINFFLDELDKNYIINFHESGECFGIISIYNHSLNYENRDHLGEFPKPNFNTSYDFKAGYFFISNYSLEVFEINQNQ